MKDPISPSIKMVFMLIMQGIAAWLLAMVFQTMFNNIVLSFGIGIFLTASLSAILSLFMSKSQALTEATILIMRTPGGIALIMVTCLLGLCVGMLATVARNAGATMIEALLSTVIVLLPQALGYYLLNPQMIEDLFSDERYQQWIRWVQRKHTARQYLKLFALMQDMNTHVRENAVPEVAMVAKAIETDLTRTHRGVRALYTAQYRQAGIEDATEFYEEALDMIEALPYEQPAPEEQQPEGEFVWE